MGTYLVTGAAGFIAARTVGLTGIRVGLVHQLVQIQAHRPRGVHLGADIHLHQDLQRDLARSPTRARHH